MRLYPSNEANPGVGWLLAVGDKQMRAAMAAMHEDPAHAWVYKSSPDVLVCRDRSSHSGSKKRWGYPRWNIFVLGCGACLSYVVANIKLNIAFWD